MPRKDLTHRIGILLLLTAAAVGAVGVFSFLASRGIGIPCLFHQLTGWLCPGCGNSRAALALLRGELWRALEYNMLFPLEFFYLAWVLVHVALTYIKTGHFSYKPKQPWLDIAILAAVVLWGIIRNLLPN